MYSPESNGEADAAPSATAGYARFWAFLAILAGLAALKVLLLSVTVPESWVKPVTIVVTAVFVAVPVYALYRAASIPWTAKLGLGLVVAGLVLHVGMQVLGGRLISVSDLGGKTLLSFRDLGFFTWCVGLGATLASILRDKNLLIPVSIFLAGFDIFLVLTPIGPVKQILEAAPQIPQAISLHIPSAAPQAAGQAPVPFAFIGPADFVFMAMFFIALYRFGLSVRETAIWLAPAIIVYLALALLVGAVPLLVPIGLTVLIVNWRHFRLNVEEWVSTGVVAILVGAAIAWGATRPIPPPQESPVEPSTMEIAPTGSESVGSPEPERAERSP